MSCGHEFSNARKASKNKYPRKTKHRKQTHFETAHAINENEKVTYMYTINIIGH